MPSDANTEMSSSAAAFDLNIDRALALASDAGATVEDLFQAVDLLRKSGSFAVADLLIHRLQSMEPPASLRLVLTQAELEAAKGNLKTALARVDALLAAGSSNLHVFRVRSSILISLGRYQDALECLVETIPDTHDRAMSLHLIYRGVALSGFMNASKVTYTFARPRQAQPAPDVVVVMMVKDEDDILLANLEHHYLLGARNFFVLDNMSNDDTRNRLLEFRRRNPDALVCDISDQVVAYYQAGKTQAVVEFAAKYLEGVRSPARWCFVLDADEFVDIPPELGGLSGLVHAAAEADVITLHLCNSAPAQLADFDPLSHDVYSFFDRTASHPPRIVSKNAFRTDIGVTIQPGNHALDYPGFSARRVRIGAELGARLVHLPFRSERQVLKKVINGGLALQATRYDKSVGLHWRRMFDELTGDQINGARAQLVRHHEGTLRDLRYDGPFTF